jgi:hypothetical protein
VSFDYGHIVLITAGKLNGGSELGLVPIDRHASPQTDVREEEIVADEYLFRLYEIGTVAIAIDSSVVKARARHEFAPPTDRTEVVGEIVVFTVNLLGIALDNRDTPTHGQVINDKHAQHVLIPKILAFSRLFMNLFLVGQREIGFIAKIEVIMYYTIAHFLDDLFVISLVDRFIQILMLERNKLHIFYAKYSLVI